MKHTTPTLIAVCLSLALAACGGGYEGSPAPNTVTNQPLAVGTTGAVTLVPTEMARYEVTGGTRPYSAKSQNAAVAIASVSDGTLSIAAVKGDVAPVTVTVSDAKGNQALLQVTVTNNPQQGGFVLSERVFSIQPGATRGITLTGGTAPFAVSALKPGVATASVTGDVVTVLGLAEGADAEIRIIDAKGHVQSAFVTVAAPMPSASGMALFSNLPANLSLRPKNSRTFTLGGGTAPYSVTTSNAAVLTASVRGAALMVQSGSAGNAQLTVTDSAGATLTQRIYVTTTSAPLTLTQSSVTGQVGTQITVGIAGGMPPYRAVSTASVLLASGAVVEDDVLLLDLAFVGGPGWVTVQDSENNTATVAVTATPVLSTLSLSPAAATISELLSPDASGLTHQTVLPILAVRGVAPYLVFTSHPNLLRPTVSGNTISVSTPGTAASPVAPCVDQNTPVTITVIDATGASASSVITIADNGDCPA